MIRTRIRSNRGHFPSNRRLLPSILVLAVLTVASSAWAKPTVDRISFAPRSDGQGYVIRFHVDGPVGAYSEPREISGGHVEMTLFNTSIAKRFKHDKAEGPVTDYSHEQSSGHTIFRFRIDRKSPVTASAYRDRASNDILLGLANAADLPTAPVVDIRDDSSVPVRPVVSLDDPGARSEAPVLKRSSNASAEARRWMLDTIVIDAGHGGHDPGAVANGFREKDITLGVALKLGEYIKENLGVDVVYTRNDDRFIELKDRGKFANARGGKLFISLHVNAAGNSKAHGTETYFIGMHKSEAARSTMERENSVVQLESDPEQYKNMNEEALIRMELTQSAYMRKSEELSGLIEEQFSSRVGRKSRGVKQAGFYVLWGASMPAILVEMGFLTNRNEAGFLSSESGQAYMASAIFRAVRDYKHQYEKGLSFVAEE